LKDKNPEITPQRMFELVKKGLTFELEFEEMLLFFLCFERGFTDGLVYEAVCEIEKTLHTKIRQILIHKYGAPESSWWINGIPCEIREECASRRERDIANFAKNTCYHYTTLGELKTILESKKNCKLFKNHLPCSLHGKEPNMDLFFRDLTTLIGIRNRVMHPIGKVRLTEEDYYFVLDMQKKLDASRWR
ncbi:MAG TPA: hypothetical protein VFB72_04875, partial [Verrucomicrobiae bacterium]|nr:hypothetical protein [Verrucomicrobiae bacterium]